MTGVDKTRCEIIRNTVSKSTKPYTHVHKHKPLVPHTTNFDFTVKNFTQQYNTIIPGFLSLVCLTLIPAFSLMLL